MPVADDALPDTVRSIVRFPYAHGAQVAATLKARSSGARRHVVCSPAATAGGCTALRVRLDDAEPFTEV